MKLRTLDYLSNIQEHNGVAISADLKCPCGCTTFSFHYKGKRTKGIFAPYVVNSKKQLVLKATCENCRNSFVLFDSSKDGSSPKDRADEIDFAPLVLHKTNQRFYKVIVKYNYRPENMYFSNFYSNKFESCFVYLIDQNGKTKALIEEYVLHTAKPTRI